MEGISRSLRASLGLALVIAACALKDKPSSEGGIHPVLEDVTSRTHFAFRADLDGAVVGAHTTYDVRVERKL